MKFRILHTEWSTGWGGQEQRIVLECRKMIERGHSALIACQPGSGILDQAKKNTIPVREVAIRSSFDLQAIRAFRQIMKAERIDVVNTHSGKDSWTAGLAAKWAGVSLLVRTRHLSVPVSTNPLNIVYKMTDGIITTGETIRQTMINDNSIRPDKIISIATGVSLDRFDETTDGRSCREALEIDSDTLVVTMVAVLRGMKRHDLLIDAVSTLIEKGLRFKVLIAGEGPMRESIEARIKEKHLEEYVHLLGYREDIPELLAATDVVVLTSGKFEGVPQSLSQAMVMGKPVVAAPVGSIGELIHDEETGLMAVIGDAESFARQLERLLTDDKLRESLATHGREHVLKNYTDDVMADKTVDFYQRLLQKKNQLREKEK